MSSKRRQRNSQPDAGSLPTRQIGRKAIETGVHAAAAEALLEGTLSAVKSALAYREGKIDGGQALMNVGKDAALSGARVGAERALGVGVRRGASHLGIPMKSNIATEALLEGTLSAWKNGLAYREGKIDGGQALMNVGKDATLSGARIGATDALRDGVQRGASHLGIPMKSNIATEVATEALLEGTLSAWKNGLAYREGKIDGGQALMNVGKDAALSGAHVRATDALRDGVQRGASHLGIPMKSNIATAVAAAFVEIGKTIYDFAKGEISVEEAGERIGVTGCSAAGGIYVGAAAGAIFGPAGAAVGSTVGYMAVACIYQSGMAVLKQARLAEEEAARLEALCAEAVQELNRRQREFEARMGRLLERRDAGFNHCFAVIDKALEANETDDIVAGLAQLVAMTGSACKFDGFEEFNQIMEQEPDTRFVI